jgi:WD repeat and SOF domain-containing protein 1
MHPFSRARERTRALNAAKMNRIFAKPFLDGLEGHVDAVECLSRKPGSLTTIASGSWDGGMCEAVSACSERDPCFRVGVILHNIAQRTRLLRLTTAHKGKVSGLCYAADKDRLLSCGVDRNIKLWDISSLGDGDESTDGPSVRHFSSKN